MKTIIGVGIALFLNASSLSAWAYYPTVLVWGYFPVLIGWYISYPVSISQPELMPRQQSCPAASAQPMALPRIPPRKATQPIIQPPAPPREAVRPRPCPARPKQVVRPSVQPPAPAREAAQPSVSPPTQARESLKPLEQRYKNLIIMFTKEQCPYCQYMKPIMERMQEKFGKDIKFLFVDIDERPHYPSQYGFKTVPQIFYFKDGKKLDVHGSDDKQMTVKRVEDKIKAYWEILNAPGASDSELSDIDESI